MTESERNSWTMTEVEWNACTDPQKMLEFLEYDDKATDRKSRFFAVACCRRIWHLLTNDLSRRAVEAGENYADGSLDGYQLADACVAASHASMGSDPYNPAYEAAANAADQDLFNNAYYAAVLSADAIRINAGGDESARLAECEHQAALARCIHGPLPFRSVTVKPVWLTSTVQQLAATIYEEKVFDRMPILGDALEEAGCSDADILNHCRQAGEHVRGCWVVDLLLGKS